MGRTKTPQKRLGKLEQPIFTKALTAIRDYKIFWRYKGKGETWHNNVLINALLQAGVDAKHNNIPVAKFMGEQFRCEAFIEGGAFPVLGIECKRVTDQNVKRVWKEGLSQAILYTAKYKRVILVFYDFTANGLLHRAFGRGNRPETSFAKDLRELGL